MDGMDLDTWCDLDLSYLLIWGEHPDLSVPGETVSPCTTTPRTS